MNAHLAAFVLAFGSLSVAAANAESEAWSFADHPLPRAAELTDAESDLLTAASEADDACESSLAAHRVIYARRYPSAPDLAVGTAAERRFIAHALKALREPDGPGGRANPGNQDVACALAGRIRRQADERFARTGRPLCSLRAPVDADDELRAFLGIGLDAVRDGDAMVGFSLLASNGPALRFDDGLTAFLLVQYDWRFHGRVDDDALGTIAPGERARIVEAAKRDDPSAFLDDPERCAAER